MGESMSDRIDIMIDLETLGLGYDSPILSIGAAVIANGEVMLGGYHVGISLEDSIAHGRVPSASTIEWWLRQAPEAQQALAKKLSTGVSVNVALLDFANWVRSRYGAYVWGNGADFDIAMLRHAFAKVGLDEPWSYRNVRCFRTYMAEFGHDEDWVQPSVKHDAQADAHAQAQTLVNCWKRMGVKHD